MADKKKDKEGKKASPVFGLLKAVAFVSVLVIVEVVAAALLIPSPQDTEQLARELAAARAGEEADDEGSEDGTAITNAQKRTEEPTIEVELGQFNVNWVNPETDKSLVVDMELYAIVLAEEEGDFLTQFEQNQNRLKDQVNATFMTIMSSDAGQLTDPGLGLIKRRILEKTNRALGKPLVREILITRFNFVER